MSTLIYGPVDGGCYILTHLTTNLPFRGKSEKLSVDKIGERVSLLTTKNLHCARSPYYCCWVGTKTRDPSVNKPNLPEPDNSDSTPPVAGSVLFMPTLTSPLIMTLCGEFLKTAVRFEWDVNRGARGDRKSIFFTCSDDHVDY